MVFGDQSIWHSGHSHEGNAEDSREDVESEDILREDNTSGCDSLRKESS